MIPLCIVLLFHLLRVNHSDRELCRAPFFTGRYGGLPISLSFAAQRAHRKLLILGYALPCLHTRTICGAGQLYPSEYAAANNRGSPQKAEKWPIRTGQLREGILSRWCMGLFP